jgi:hypothetical protein
LLISFTRNFTKDDIQVLINHVNGTIKFVVIDPDKRSPIPAGIVQEATSGVFTSILYGLSLTVAQIGKENEEQSWYLIVGICAGVALVVAAVILSVIM